MFVLICTCDYCGKVYRDRNVEFALMHEHRFCSLECLKELKRVSSKRVVNIPLEILSSKSPYYIVKPCGQCGKEVTRSITEYAKSLTGNVFCNHSCSASYANSHKTKGTRVSKLELYLADCLQKMYPATEFVFNGKVVINSELDIYLPEYKLAFELNGIFHYEPIYGEVKLSQTQNNDNRKFQACLEKGIELVIIDTSGQKYFKDKTAKKYLDIITKIIDGKVNPPPK